MECWAWAAEYHAQQSSIQAKFGEPLIILALSLSRVNADHSSAAGLLPVGEQALHTKSDDDCLIVWTSLQLFNLCTLLVRPSGS
jgi:hypothetical protein